MTKIIVNGRIEHIQIKDFQGVKTTVVQMINKSEKKGFEIIKIKLVDESVIVKEGDIVKPFIENNKYVIVKLNKKNLSQPLSFEQAVSLVTKDYEKNLKDKKLDELANSQLKEFKGTDISGVTRESVNKISGLAQQESSKFLNQLFSSTSKEGIVKLDGKLVLFRINNSKFAVGA